MCTVVASAIICVQCIKMQFNVICAKLWWSCLCTSIVKIITSNWCRTAVAKAGVLFCCTGSTRNVNGKNRKHGEVRVGETKRRSKWQMFSLADWIWTWQFANGLFPSLLYMLRPVIRQASAVSECFTVLVHVCCSTWGISLMQVFRILTRLEFFQPKSIDPLMLCPNSIYIRQRGHLIFLSTGSKCCW